MGPSHNISPKIDLGSPALADDGSRPLLDHQTTQRVPPPPHSATSISWSPLEKLYSPAVFGSMSDVVCPFLLQLTNSASNVVSRRPQEIVYRKQSRGTARRDAHESSKRPPHLRLIDRR
ncbi:hypothetical protein EVAR_28113_1 [Eumeta japonica]|uniref:Uncharacterized protein n=1 Tax=Eumeta variegata TaxID=151549 RepID=A0A4C1VET4_EUMVA|nr:hypothetical protein EVAR_28113_1 [Eumeta japonica]